MASAAILVSPRLHAAPIHHDRDARSLRPNGSPRWRPPRAYKTWSEYLTGGAERLVDDRSSAGDTGGRSGDLEGIRTDPARNEPVVQFFLYKQSLDPTRFDHYHPKVSKALTRLSASTPPINFVSPPATTPGDSTSSPPTQRQSITPIPEPGTLLLAVGFLGWGVWRFRRPRPGARDSD